MALRVCTQCLGTGKVTPPGQPEITCDACRGTGQMETDWVATISEIRGLVDTVEASLAVQDIEIAAIKNKVDAIIAEQASQRVDLTAALTQIWNKVKDL